MMMMTVENCFKNVMSLNIFFFVVQTKKKNIEKKVEWEGIKDALDTKHRKN